MSAASHPQSPFAAPIAGSYLERIETARDLMGRGQWAEAIAIQRRIVDRISGLPERRRLLGSELSDHLVTATYDLHLALLRLGDLEGAVQAVRQLAAWDPEGASLWRRREHVLRVEAGEVEQGLAGLRSLVDAEPDNAAFWLELARQQLDLRRYEEAEASLERTAALAQAAGDDETFAATLVNRYLLCREQGRYDEAATAWRQAVRADPDLGSGGEALVRMYLEAGLVDQAARVIDQEAMETSVADYYRACIAFRRGDVVRARYLWRQVAGLPTGEDFPLLLTKAQALCWLERPLEAVALLLPMAHLSQTVPRLAMLLALGWAIQGNSEAAHANLSLAQRRLSGGDDPVLLPALDWYDFEHLVTDEDLKDSLRPYFDSDGADAPTDG